MSHGVAVTLPSSAPLPEPGVVLSSLKGASLWPWLPALPNEDVGAQPHSRARHSATNAVVRRHRGAAARVILKLEAPCGCGGGDGACRGLPAATGARGARFAEVYAQGGSRRDTASERSDALERAARVTHAALYRQCFAARRSANTAAAGAHDKQS